MRPQASSMIKFGYVMLALNLLLAVGAYFMNKSVAGNPAYDNIALPTPAMFLGGGCIWIVGILIWYKAQKDEEGQ